MSLAEYFESIKGIGVLATSDSDGNVNTAIYSRPYIIDDNTVAFSMLCLLYTSPSPRDLSTSRMPSSA